VNSPCTFGVWPSVRPQHAIIERREDVVVVAERHCQCRLAKAARAGERGRDRNGIAVLCSEEQPLQCVKLARTGHEVSGQRRCHEWHAHRLCAPAQVGNERLPLHVEVVAVNLRHPTWDVRARRIEAWTLHREHRDAALPCGTPLAARHLRFERRGRHGDHEELDVLDRLLDLAPPANTAFDLRAVLPNAQIGCRLRKPRAKRIRERFAIAPRVRDEEPGLARYAWGSDVSGRRRIRNTAELTRRGVSRFLRLRLQLR